jgi:hypothetical protein
LIAVIVTAVPTGPAIGEIDVMVGGTDSAVTVRVMLVLAVSLPSLALTSKV